MCTVKLSVSYNGLDFFRQQGMPAFLPLKFCRSLACLIVFNGIKLGISFPILFKDIIYCKLLHPIMQMNLVQNNIPVLPALSFTIHIQLM